MDTLDKLPHAFFLDDVTKGVCAKTRKRTNCSSTTKNHPMATTPTALADRPLHPHHWHGPVAYPSSTHSGIPLHGTREGVEVAYLREQPLELLLFLSRHLVGAVFLLREDAVLHLPPEIFKPSAHLTAAAAMAQGSRATDV